MDQKLFPLINQHWTAPALDRIMALLSNFEAWILPLCLLVFLFLWRGGFRGYALVICATLIVAVNDGIISHSLKMLVNRPRPHQTAERVRQVELAPAVPRFLGVMEPPKIKMSEPPADLKSVVGHSFPSSHTVNTISVALLVACFYRRFGWIAFIPAFGVGYSRIYTGAHWPTDVCASIFIGLGATLLLLAFFEWLWGRAGRRWWPEFLEAHPSLFHS
ncbi:MAG TPA: phosphatase PAP2 family protein [Chthoniobacter sp.]|jgi:undecaprenyl-diphosphatase